MQHASAMASGRPEKTDAPMRKCPIFSSTIWCIAATAPTVSKQSPWPACTSIPVRICGRLDVRSHLEPLCRHPHGHGNRFRYAVQLYPHPAQHLPRFARVRIDKKRNANSLGFERRIIRANTGLAQHIQAAFAVTSSCSALNNRHWVDVQSDVRISSLPPSPCLMAGQFRAPTVQYPHLECVVFAQMRGNAIRSALCGNCSRVPDPANCRRVRF